MKEYTYQEQNNIENQKKLREVLSELPAFALSFFGGLNRGHPHEPGWAMAMI